MRTLVRYRMRPPDPALPEDAENVNKLAHILQQSPSLSKGDRTGSNGTKNEQRAKDTVSTRASLQESGGQIHLMEDEIDLYETDLAESMAIWGFGEDDEDHMSLRGALQQVWTVVFLHGGYQGAWDGSVVGVPGSTVFAHRIAIDLPFHLCMRFFSFKSEPFCLATRVHRFLILTSPHSTKALCLLHQCRVRSLSEFLLLGGPHELLKSPEH